MEDLDIIPEHIVLKDIDTESKDSRIASEDQILAEISSTILEDLKAEVLSIALQYQVVEDLGIAMEDLTAEDVAATENLDIRDDPRYQ